MLPTRDPHRLKMKGWKKIFRANGNKKARVAIPISDKINFETKAIKTDKEGHYKMMKGSIQEENIILVIIFLLLILYNINASNIGAHKYIKTNTNKR